MARVGVVSFRFGGADGVSVEAAKWCWALRELGHTVRTVAGRGLVDDLVLGLAWPLREVPAPTVEQVRRALDTCDVVIVENLCSLPLHPPASAAVAAALQGRPAILHHYDLPWERERFTSLAWSPPDDPGWRHVCISHHAAATLRTRLAVEPMVEHLRIAPGWAAGGRREATRAELGVAAGERLLLQPSRAIARKGIPDAMALAGRADATYWLTGPAEEGYDSTLDDLRVHSGTKLLRRLPPRVTMQDAYAAADAVVVASTWEGFGLPLLEAAVARKPLAVRRYPVAQELEGLYGFDWLPIDDPAAVRQAMDEPDEAMLGTNEAAVHEHLDVAELPGRLERMLDEL